jgi:hypothetical protein
MNKMSPGLQENTNYNDRELLPRGCVSRPIHALSPCPTIGKEHHLGMPTRSSAGVLTPKKITIQRQLMVPSSSSNDDLPLVRHDTRVDLNSGGARIRYTQEPALMSDSPPWSLLPYIVSWQWIRVGHGKVLIPNPEYKGKGHTKSASSNPTPRLRCLPPPKIYGLPGMMEFFDDKEEEKEELSNKLVTSRKKKITTVEEQIAELHLVVYDQQDDFSVLHKATTSKLMCFATALGDHRVALEKFGSNFKGIRIRSCLLSIISLFIQK